MNKLMSVIALSLLATASQADTPGAQGFPSQAGSGPMAYPQQAATAPSQEQNPDVPASGPAATTGQTIGIYTNIIPVVSTEFPEWNDYGPTSPNERAARPLPSETKDQLEAKLRDEVEADAKKITDAMTRTMAQDVRNDTGGQVAWYPLPTNDMESACQDIDFTSSIQKYGQCLAELPYMEKQKALIALVFTKGPEFTTDYEGHVTNPDPMGWAYRREVQQKGILGSIGEGLQHIAKHGILASATKPLEFDGTVTVSFQAKYTLISVASGQILRSGVIGPIKETSPSFHASWEFRKLPPSNNILQRMAGFQNGLGQDKFDDPRAKVIAQVIKDMQPQIIQATQESLHDWPQVVQAADQLLAGQH